MFFLQLGLNPGGCFWKDEVCTKTDKAGSVASGRFGGPLAPPAPPTHADPLALGGSIFRPLCKLEKTTETLNDVKVELVSKELNHFGVIAGLFRQIGGHSSRFLLFCSF